MGSNNPSLCEQDRRRRRGEVEGFNKGRTTIGRDESVGCRRMKSELMTTAILILLYFALLVFALMAAYEMSPPDWHTGFDGFVKILTIAVTVVSAFMTALVGIINFDRSAKLSKELIGEKLEAAKKLERCKSNLTEENSTYGDFLATATTSYYTP